MKFMVDYSAALTGRVFCVGRIACCDWVKLVRIDDYWSLQASEIITGCPSKYETVDN